MNKPLPTLKYLRECFTYAASTGVLRWRERPQSHFVSDHARRTWNTRFAGTVAGSKNKKGYLHVMMQGSFWLLQRVVWKLMAGKDPGAMTVDHKNTVRTDNRWRNLRLATGTEQNANRTSVTSNTGVKGIHTHGNRFVAQVKKHGKNYRQSFADIETAQRWLTGMRRKLHGAFANGGAV